MIDREDLKSVKFITEKSIEKGLGQDLSYEGVKAEKTGSEIKEKLKERLVVLSVNKSKKFSEIEEISKLLTESPKDDLNEWELKGMKERISAVPMKYSHEQIYAIQGQPNKEMLLYNKRLDEYIELAVDCLLIKTIIDNIKENIKFQLNIQLASKMGF